MSKVHGFFLREAARRTQWSEVQAGVLCGLAAGEVRPGLPTLIWAHGLGGSCAADEARGLGALLCPELLGDSRLLRLDLRGHGRSVASHEAARAADQYTWPALAGDLLSAARADAAAAAPLAQPLLFGGEGSGAAVALHAATTARGKEVPAGLVLMRPPVMWGARHTWILRYRLAAQWAEKDGLESKDVENEAKRRLTHASFAMEASQEAVNVALKEWRNMGVEAYTAALRGLADSVLPADDDLRTLQIPALIFAVEGDVEHPVEAAEDLASLLPRSKLVVARSMEEARDTWPPLLRDFLLASPLPTPAIAAPTGRAAAAAA